MSQCKFYNITFSSVNHKIDLYVPDSYRKSNFQPSKQDQCQRQHQSIITQK